MRASLANLLPGFDQCWDWIRRRSTHSTGRNLEPCHLYLWISQTGSPNACTHDFEFSSSEGHGNTFGPPVYPTSAGLRV
eukprot:SM000188S03811  [mRNA]  locus=s188:196603:196839:+ [translate_table: standard]